jgi:Leucine-rich repeat (LRR) protein
MPISAEMINGGNQLVSLNLDNTTLSDISFIGKLRNLREFYVSNNQVDRLIVKMMEKNGELTYVAMSGNPLIDIDIENVDKILPKLVVLDLNNVQFSNCRTIFDLYNYAKDKSLTLNINDKILDVCLNAK